MPNFTTLNKFDTQGHPVKYDNYATEEEAQGRIVELHAMGYTDAFYIDSDATMHGGEHCMQGCTHWIADIVNKTVAHNKPEADAEQLVTDTKSWKHQMLASDLLLSRFDEDMYDALDQTVRDRLPQKLKDNVAAKKTLRQTKPT